MRHIINLLIVLALLILYKEPLPNSGANIWANEKNISELEMEYSAWYQKNTTPSLQVYFAIKKYCKMYNVPEMYAFKVAYIESGWKEPFHYAYNPYNKISTANAQGAMQILPSTGRDVWKDKSITEAKLLNDIDFNVHTGIKYMRQLYDIHHDWGKVYAIYNTGYTTLNDYALSVVNHG